MGRRSRDNGGGKEGKREDTNRKARGGEEEQRAEQMLNEGKGTVDGGVGRRNREIRSV